MVIQIINKIYGMLGVGECKGKNKRTGRGGLVGLGGAAVTWGEGQGSPHPEGHM